MNEDLKIIKKYYGEKMMHLCRELFPTLLEKTGLLSKLMLDNFDSHRFLYSDIKQSNSVENFKNYIYSLVEASSKKTLPVTKTPEELLSDAGYILYECKSESQIQKFKKYYAKGEALCTFKDKRLDNCYVFFAVKKNVNEIKREDFEYPSRQDEYGTSVISIQFTKGFVNTLSIKNRYNHTVENPDATFSNNLENIIEGLTESFEKKYNFHINQNDNNGFELPGYVKANDGKYYKYNYERNNVYYCPNNIIIDNFEVKKYDKEKYIVIDFFVLDLVNKEIKTYKQGARLKDSFAESIENIKKISITKDKKTKNKQIEIITNDENKIVIEIDKKNRIIGYSDQKITELKSGFLAYAQELRKLELPSVEKIRNNVLYFNQKLTNLSLPNLKIVGSDFLYFNKTIKNIDFPKLEEVDDCFLCCNENLVTLNLPNLKVIGDQFLYENKKIKSVNLPKLNQVESYFLYSNTDLLILELPNLEIAKNNFLDQNKNLINLSMPKLRLVGNDFLASNIHLSVLELPELQQTGNNFLLLNLDIIKLNLPKLIKVGNGFFRFNQNLNSLELPELEQVGDNFFFINQNLVVLKMPKLKQVGNGFFHNNKIISTLELPNLLAVGDEFMLLNNSLTNLDFPSLISVGKDFMTLNKCLINVNLPGLDDSYKSKIQFYKNKKKQKAKVKKIKY